MPTIGYRRPRSSPRGDVQAGCSYCGAQWLRSKLYKDQDGNLVCPDEGNGRPSSTLNELNAEGAKEQHRRADYPPAENYVKEDIDQEAVYITDGSGF